MFSYVLHRRVLLFTLCLAATMSFSCLFLMTAEYDEAWVIASARQAFDPVAIPQVPPVTTTGGLHFLLVGMTAGTSIDPILTARALSCLAVVALIGLICLKTWHWHASDVERLLFAVTCCAAPGTMLMAGMGYGVGLATLLFVAGILVLLWGEGPIRLTNALIAGVLIGVALATRWTFLPALPALLLIPVFDRTRWKTSLLYVLLTLALALAVLFGFMTFQISQLAGTGPGQHVSLADNARGAGASFALPQPTRVLAFLARFSSTLPVVLVAIALVAWWDLRDIPRQRRFMLVLAASATLIALAWALRSPWMHVRYIWPAYFFISCCAGLGLAHLYRRGQQKDLPALCALAVLTPVLLMAAQLVLALRLVAVGAGMQVNAAGYENLENHYKPLYLKAEEREIIRFLRKQTPMGTVLGTVGLPGEHGALELSLMSGRVVHDFAILPEANLVPDYIIIHRFSPFNDAGREWLGRLGAPVAQIKGYTLYPFPPSVGIPAAEEIVLDQQLYRFALSKWASLTGW